MLLVADPFSAPDQTTGAPANVDPFARIATLTVAIVGVGGAGVAGTAFCLYKEVLTVCWYSYSGNQYIPLFDDRIIALLRSMYTMC